MNYNTGRYINGEEIILGDKLYSPESYEGVVLYDRDNQEYCVQIIEKPLLIFSLDRYLSEWKHIKKIGNIIIR